MATKKKTTKKVAAKKATKQISPKEENAVKAVESEKTQAKPEKETTATVTAKPEKEKEQVAKATAPEKVTTTKTKKPEKAKPARAAKKPEKGETIDARIKKWIASHSAVPFSEEDFQDIKRALADKSKIVISRGLGSAATIEILDVGPGEDSRSKLAQSRPTSVLSV